MNKTRCRHDSATPQDAGRDSFTPDMADMLCQKCVLANRGLGNGKFPRVFIQNLPSAYRVVVTTEAEETDLEFDKLSGGTRFWRDGKGGAEWN